MGKVRYTSLQGERKSIVLLLSSLASPARPSDNNKMKVKISNPEIGTYNILKSQFLPHRKHFNRPFRFVGLHI
jgi:hypothetical protein